MKTNPKLEDRNPIETRVTQVQTNLALTQTSYLGFRISTFVAVMIAVLLGWAPSLAQSNLVTQFEHLKQPKISLKKNEKLAVVEAKGDPNVVGGRAFGLLFQLYFSSPQTPRDPLQGVPRARWPESLQAPKTEWTGLYALPVPESVTQLPPYQAQEGLKASLGTWEYGEVAELLCGSAIGRRVL
jgi:hypothetical protein